MILSQAQMEPSAELLANNTAMAARFSARGADLDLVNSMTFSCDFADGKSAHAYLAAFRSLNLAYITAAEPWMCENDVLPVMMPIELSMGFDVANISKVECVLIAISEKFGGGEVSWEYQSIETAPQERVN